MAEPRRAPGPAPATGEQWLFSVRVGASRYAFDAGLVSEVVRVGPLTRLPAAPAFLPGVFAHRGEILAVLDLARLLGPRPVAMGASTRAAVVRAGPWHLALVADAVEGLSAVSGLEPPPADGAVAAPWLTAVAQDAAGPLAVLDLPSLVASARARSGGP